MTISKKISHVGATITAFLMPIMVSAQGGGFGAAKDSLGKIGNKVGGISNNEDALPVLIGNIINAVLGFMGIILLGYFLYAGFLWMTSGGDDKKVGEAKTMIRNAIVGLIIIVASVAISNFVIKSLITATQTN